MEIQANSRFHRINAELVAEYELLCVQLARHEDATKCVSNDAYDPIAAEEMPETVEHELSQEMEEQTCIQYSEPVIAEDLIRQAWSDLPSKQSALKDPERVKNFVSQVVKDAQRTLHGHIKFQPATFYVDGLFSTVAKSPQFEFASVVLILLNCIWVGIGPDRKAFQLPNVDVRIIVLIGQCMFCAAFATENLIRFLAFRTKSHMLRDFWLLFDVVTVVGMVLELLITFWSAKGLDISILRLFQLLRVARLSLVIHTIPEYYSMVHGITGAFRSLACTACLLLGVLFIFAVLLRDLSEGTHMGMEYFSHLWHGMFSLFVHATLLDDITTFLSDIHEESVTCAFLVVCVVIIAGYAITNMLLGITCDIMISSQQNQREESAMRRAAKQVREALFGSNAMYSDCISKEEFEQILVNPVALKALHKLGVDIVALVDFADVIFQSDKHGNCFDRKWPFHEFMEFIMQAARTTRCATVRDIFHLRKFFHAEITATNRMVMDLNSTLAKNERTKLGL